MRAGWPLFAGLRWLLAGVLFAVAVSGAAGADRPAVDSILKPLNLRGYSPGTMPPPFSGRTLDARRVSLTELRGQVVIVNFWATWCLECRPEMPVLEQLHREFASRGLAVIGINAYESKSAARRYATELGLTFPLVLDQDRKINAQYGVIGLPTTFVVGRDGYAVAFGIGPREWAGAPARALIGALLAEATSRQDGR